MRQLIVTVLDTETTGLKQEQGHKIVEVAMALLKVRFNDDNSYHSYEQVGKIWNQRINPLRAIDAGAELVHGISITSLRDEPVWEDVAPKVHKILSAIDVAVAHNVEFDIPFIAFELMRIGLELPTFEIFCTMQQGRSATGLGTVPNLQKLCWAMGVPYNVDDAHAADYDVDCTVKSFIKGLELDYFNLDKALNLKYSAASKAA